MHIKNWLNYLILPVYKPSKSLDKLLNDKYRVAYGLTILLFIGGLYAVATYVGYLNGFGAVNQPFLTIPQDEYYFWETFFGTPAFFIVCIVFAGLVRLFSMIFKGEGSFENMIAVYGVVNTLPMLLTMWIPEASLMIFLPELRATELGGFSFMPIWVDAVRQIIGVIWPLVIVVFAIHKSEKIKWWQSIVVLILAMGPTVFLMLIFIR